MQMPLVTHCVLNLKLNKKILIMKRITLIYLFLGFFFCAVASCTGNKAQQPLENSNDIEQSSEKDSVTELPLPPTQTNETEQSVENEKMIEKVVEISTVECKDTFKISENLFQTWVLIEKEINNIKETPPTNDTYYSCHYPVTLTFYPTISTEPSMSFNFSGRADNNSYRGTYKISGNTISFFAGEMFATDGMGGGKWYRNYLSELHKINNVFIFSQGEDTNNMHLQLSNADGSIKLYFINKKWFEKTYFKLEEGYKYY